MAANPTPKKMTTTTKPSKLIDHATLKKVVGGVTHKIK